MSNTPAIARARTAVHELNVLSQVVSQGAVGGYSTELGRDLVGIYENGLKEIISKSVRVAASKAFTEVNRDLRSIGSHGIIGKDEFIESFSAKFLRRRVFEKTALERIHVSGRLLNRAIKKVIRFGKSNRLSADAVDNLIVKKVMGKTIVGGGWSPMKWSRALVIGETHRANVEAYLEIAKLQDVVLVKWILNPHHPPYKHLEICEFYAQTVDPAVTGILHGGEPGVFKIDRFPKTPHPFCGCSPAVYS